MKGIWPIVVVEDRYNGTYSGATWTAFNSWDVPAGALGDDLSCNEFFREPNQPIGKGDTPTEAAENLVANMPKIK